MDRERDVERGHGTLSDLDLQTESEDQNVTEGHHHQPLVIETCAIRPSRASSLPDRSLQMNHQDHLQTAPPRPASSQPEPVPINPARAALINSPETSAPSMSIRGQAQERPSKAPSRGVISSAEDDEKRGPPRSERDERPTPDRRPEAHIRIDQRHPTTICQLIQECAVINQDDSHGRVVHPTHQAQRSTCNMVDLSRIQSQRPPPRHERPTEAEVPFWSREVEEVQCQLHEGEELRQ